MKKQKKKKEKPTQVDDIEDPICGSFLVNAATGTVRSYILAKLCTGEKKYVGEITKAQHADHQRLMEQINHELQDKLGCGLAEVKAWARQRKLQLLDQPPRSAFTHTHKHWPKP